MGGMPSKVLFASATFFLARSAPSFAQPSDIPIVANAKAGPCRMTIKGQNSSFLIEVTGLAPGEGLKVTSNSEGELVHWDDTAESDGGFATIVVPLVKGKSFGRASLEVVGSRCRIEASYPWRE